jgi:polar amino acid transport system substrate-binding protein
MNRTRIIERSQRTAVIVLLALLVACATHPSPPPEVAAALAPTGTLRAAINLGNPVLAQRDPATGAPRGVSVDLAQELGRRLGVPVVLVTYDAAGKVTDAVATQSWDVAFLAIDPGRATGIDFTAPYVVIEGTYMVPAGSPLRAIGDVDREGVRIAVGNKSAYDLYLTRTIKRAQLVRTPTSPAAIELFMQDRLEAVAGVKQPLVSFARGNPDVRVIDGRFMAIEQAVAIPRGRDAALPYVRTFVEEMKASGFVAASLARSGQGDASVAPPAAPR